MRNLLRGLAPLATEGRGRAAVSGLVLALVTFAVTAPAGAQEHHTKYRVKIDSTPQQAAIYVNDKTAGIQGYTPSTLRLVRGTYKIIVELPGFKPMEHSIEVKSAKGVQPFLFTLERAIRPVVLDVRSVGNDSATGGQLLVDGQPAGTVPAHMELPAGKHVVEVTKAGFKPFRDTMDAQEGDTRTMVVDLTPELKKGSLLVTADVQGADVYVDGVRRDAAPTMVADLPEGDHTVEVRKDPLPPFKQVVQIVGNQQTKVEARFADKQGGTLRIVCMVPDADVILDGEPKGKVNTDIAVARPGQHLVEVRAPNFAPQNLDVTIPAGEARVIRVELAPAGAPNNNGMPPEGVARLRVVTAVPDAEVFLDGTLLGKGSIDRRDLPAGKHFVVVRKAGFAEWKREVDLAPGQGVSLTADLAASGTIKIFSNLPGDVTLDGQMVGRTPAILPDVPAGEHLIEVTRPGHQVARLQVHVEGGQSKAYQAELVPLHNGPTAQDTMRRTRQSSSFSAVTLDPGRFTFDLAAGVLPFADLRLTVGAWRKGMFGIDAGVGVRTDGYMTEAGAHAKFQFLKAGPVAIGTQVYIGGGGGPESRNDFTFELGIPISLLFGEIVRVTLNPYYQVSTDRLCPSTPQLTDEPTVCHSIEGNAPAGKSEWDGRFNQSPRDRFVTNRLMLQAAIEVAVHQVATVFLIFEGAPTGERAGYDGSTTTGYSPGFAWKNDPQIYGRLGVTFKF